MLYYLTFLLFSSTIANGLPRQERTRNGDPEPKQLLYIIERIRNEIDPQPQQFQPQLKQQPERQQEGPSHITLENQRQSITPDLPYGALAYLEPQFQYPGFNFLQEKQPYPRVQPQIVFYGPGGQGQPILINPGSPPGNFLVPQHPQQPGPNVIIRDTPQRPVFVAGYPKPAHIPPIEKDAEEVPTNPAKIPPHRSPSARKPEKPEKLETFNEGKYDYPSKAGGDSEFLEPADRNPQLIPRPQLKPGQRFFILNGEDLFTNVPFQSNHEMSLKFAQSQSEQLPLPAFRQPQYLPKENELNLNALPIQTLLLRNAVTGQISDVKDLSVQEKLPENLVALNQPTSQEVYFRSSLPLNIGAADNQQIGQFRYTSPSEPYFSFDGDDIENDAIVVDANVEDTTGSNADSSSETISKPRKEPEPSTAQAAPGAIALAGPGGVAGAAPRGTALVGRGGLAVSSPQATAVAGPSKEDDKSKKSARKNK